jgi:hypothetical protein
MSKNKPLLKDIGFAGLWFMVSLTQNRFKLLFYLSLFIIIISIVLLHVAVVSNPIFRGILYFILALAIAYIVFWVLVFAIIYIVVSKINKG